MNILDDYKNKIDFFPLINKPDPDKEYFVGDVLNIDRIESVCIYKAESPQSWGQYIWADRNHDLCYYINGSDWVDYDVSQESSDSEDPPEPYAFSWNTDSYRQDSTDIGSGLNNTNSEISTLLVTFSSESKCYFLWNRVLEFRNYYSDKWFVPSSSELVELYNQRSLCNNLSLNTLPTYWSSSAVGTMGSPYLINVVNFKTGALSGLSSLFYNYRVRLCRYS